MPTNYEAKARKTDREFSGVEYVRNGPPGPVLTLLRSMPPTIGLVVGARVSSRAASSSFCLTALRRDRSARPGRFGCCHGQDQARGMIADFISSAFGRVSLRGVGRVRHAALTAAMGSKQYATGHSTSTSMPTRGVENAWESTGDRAPQGSGRIYLPSVRAGVAQSWAGS